MFSSSVMTEFQSKLSVYKLLLFIIKHDYVHFVVGFTNFWAQL